MVLPGVSCCYQAYHGVTRRIMVLPGVSCCYQAYHGVTRCIMVLLGVSCCYQAYHGVTRRIMLLPGVSWCYQAYHVVTRRIMVLPGVSWCYQAYPLVSMRAPDYSEFVNYFALLNSPVLSVTTMIIMKCVLQLEYDNRLTILYIKERMFVNKIEGIPTGYIMAACV